MKSKTALTLMTPLNSLYALTPLNSLSTLTALKPLKARFLLLILFVGLIGCGEENISGNQDDNEQEQISDSINKILPLGASRVEGARPDYESFRYELWKDLVENDWVFDFIGTQSDQADYPTFSGKDFDRDHEGRGGWTSGQILEGLPGWLEQTGGPDVVLFSSPGGNDMLEGLDFDNAASNINQIIDELRAANPEVIIVIEEMAPGLQELFNSAELSAYYAGLHELVSSIVSEKSTDSSPIIPIDMHTGFSDELLADDVHYNETGANFIASRYYEVLNEVLQR